MPGISCRTRKPATRSRGFSAKRSNAQAYILDMRGVEELQPAKFHERNVPPRQLDLQRAAVMRRSKQHRLLLQSCASLAVFQHALDNAAGLVGLVAHG